MEEIVTCSLMVQKFINLKQDSEIHGYSLCLGNISKDWSTDNMKKTGLKGYVYDFSTDYGYSPISDIVDIHRYLIEKNKIV